MGVGFDVAFICQRGPVLSEVAYARFRSPSAQRNKKKKLRGRRIKRPSRRRPTHTHTRARARTHEKRLSTLRAALMASPSSTIETFLFHFYILSRVGLFHRETREIEVIEVNNKKKSTTSPAILVRIMMKSSSVEVKRKMKQKRVFFSHFFFGLFFF